VVRGAGEVGKVEGGRWEGVYVPVAGFCGPPCVGPGRDVHL